MKRLASILFSVAFTLSSLGWTMPFSCNTFFMSNAEKNLWYISDASQNIASKIFSTEDILSDPVKYKRFLKKLNSVQLLKIHESEIESLVEVYLKDFFRNDPNISLNKSTASLDLLSANYTKLISVALQNKGLAVDPKKFTISNTFRSITFASIWSVLAWKVQIYFPIYLPDYKKTDLNSHQRQILLEELPKLSPTEGIKLIERQIPGINGLNLYQRIRHFYSRLTILTLTTTLLFSQPSLHYLDVYTPFGAPMKKINAEAQYRWDQVFADKEEMQNQVMAIQATMNGIDLNDPIAAQILRESVQKMTFKELHDFLN